MSGSAISRIYVCLYVCGSAGTSTHKAARALSLSRQRGHFHSFKAASFRQREFHAARAQLHALHGRTQQFNSHSHRRAQKHVRPQTAAPKAAPKAVPGHVGGERVCRIPTELLSMEPCCRWPAVDGLLSMEPAVEGGLVTIWRVRAVTHWWLCPRDLVGRDDGLSS